MTHNLDPDPLQFIEQLLDLNDTTTQKTLLQNQISQLQDSTWVEELAKTLKQRADHYLRREIGRAQSCAQLINYLAEASDQPLYQALSLRAEGNIHGIGLGNFQEAVACYDAAADIYRQQGHLVEEAQSQVGKIGCLARLGRYQEAFRLGAWAKDILRQHQRWELLIGLLINLAVLHYRWGQGEDGLALLDEAYAICQETGMARDLPGIEVNKALVLRVLGRLEDSIAASQRAWQLFNEREQTVGAALAQQIQATTYLFYGRFNEALILFDQVRNVYLADGRVYEAIVVELFLSDCLLQLGRFQEALDSCRQVRVLFVERGAKHEIAQSYLNEAIAWAGLRQYKQAVIALDEAHARFTATDNIIWATISHLEKATILQQQGDYQASYDLAQQCAAFLQKSQHPLPALQAYLLAARAAFYLEKTQEVQRLLATIQAMDDIENTPWLQYQHHHLQALLAQNDHNHQEALSAYEQAIDCIEQLRGQLMIEFRADFLANKQRIYEDVVAFCLGLDDAERALQYVERAKSRALVEMIAFQLDLRLHPRSSADHGLVDKLQQLRHRRNQLVRRWSAMGVTEKAEAAEIQEEVGQLEQKMTQLWHRLLVRNADYAQDAALAQVRVEPVQPYLDEKSLLIEYFVAHDELLVFLVSNTAVTVHPLPGILRQLVLPARRLELSLKAVPHSRPTQAHQLATHTQQQLQELYRLLLEPLTATLSQYERLIFVPHGALLHYLPLHALHDGRHYLIEQYGVSYLPSASLLHYISTRKAMRGEETTLSAAAFGYSCDGRIPHASQEATTLAQLLDGEAYLEAEATIHQLQTIGPKSAVLHLATHGDFNQNNPLFSGLTMADGQLSTLDIFNLRLQASLVTLSACQTGHSVVRGGDELLGLMRAFLHAGAASLVLTHWLVADLATLQLMAQFYQQLAQGESKGDALRNAQQAFIHAPPAEQYRHPYYWAPFFLVGDTGQL